MASCYQVESIVKLFNVCYQALCKKLSSNFNGKYSILQYIVNAEKLETGRGRFKSRANTKLKQFHGDSVIRGSTHVRNLHASQREVRAKRTAALEAKDLIKSYNQEVETFMSSGKRKKDSIDDLFSPLEEPTRKTKKAKPGGKKKGKCKNKRRKTI